MVKDSLKEIRTQVILENFSLWIVFGWDIESADLPKNIEYNKGFYKNNKPFFHNTLLFMISWSLIFLPKEDRA